MAEGNSSADGSQSKQPAPTQNRSVSDSLVRNEQSRGRPAKIRDRKQLLPLRTDLFYASGDSPNVPKTVVATPPQLNFTPIEQTSSARRIMSTSALGSGDRLRPLTPIHNKNRSGTFFTTSPANSESGSPRLPASNIRSASNTSLQNLHTSGRTTPTPTRGRPGRGRNRRHQSSSHHHSPHSRKSSASNSGSSRPSTPHQNGKPSVKHLTCFWWKDKGDCRFKEEDCLYAHHDTGLYADPPRQVNPGEPALAGRSLDRALKKLQYRDDGGCNNNKSSSSLRSISTDMVIGNAIVSSRPGTPGVAVAIGPLSSPALPELVKEDELVALKSENNFFRNIVEQNTSEKALLLDNIEILQRDNKALQTAHATLTTEKQQIESERDQLRGVVTQIQDRQRLTAFTNPFGAIGTPVHPAIRRTARVVDSISDSSTENTPSNDSELERQNTNMREMLRNYGVSP